MFYDKNDKLIVKCIPKKIIKYKSIKPGAFILKKYWHYLNNFETSYSWIYFDNKYCIVRRVIYTYNNFD